MLQLTLLPGLTVNLFPLLLIALVVGSLSGFMGCGGGFLMTPALLIFGFAANLAVGTSLFVIIFSSSYGALRHTMNGNVVVFVAFVLLLASSIGVLLGAALTRHVSGRAMRLVLAVSVLLCTMGSVFKLLALVLVRSSAWLDTAAMIAILGSIGLLMASIGGLCILVIRRKRGRSIPSWAEWLITEDACTST